MLASSQILRVMETPEVPGARITSAMVRKICSGASGEEDRLRSGGSPSGPSPANRTVAYARPFSSQRKTQRTAQRVISCNDKIHAGGGFD